MKISTIARRMRYNSDPWWSDSAKLIMIRPSPHLNATFSSNTSPGIHKNRESYMNASSEPGSETHPTPTTTEPRPVKSSLMPLFQTWIYQCQDGPRHLNQSLEELAYKLMQDDGNATRRTNVGGWHYAFDFFKLKETLVAQFHREMEQHVQGFINHFRPKEKRKKDNFRLQGWINVNRANHSNVLHCHPGCFLSATYYVKIPEAMKGGEIVFRDPRGPAVAMYETPGIELPWVGTGIGISFSPLAGHLLIFPSWLEHRVEPFEGVGDRISIAFNAINP
jgi:uncharacterized protein (TIGR02466 family)